MARNELQEACGLRLHLSKRQLPYWVFEALGCQEEKDAELQRGAVGEALARLDHLQWFVFGGLAGMAV
jgi:hypothetical protein